MIISHKYEVQDQLGQGSMGVVYKVRHIALETISALKVLPTHLMGNPEVVKRFYREARVMARLHHPHIARVIDIQRDDDHQFYYFVMEYIQGQTLRQYLQERGALPLREVIEITRQVARALDSAHSHSPQVIHRDIKPTNIMIEDRTRRVVVMDFGIAKELDESEMTRAGTMLGTLKYCPPEQMRHEPLDGSADVYALGMVMYEAYTGTHLLAGLGKEDVIRKVLEPKENELSFTRGTPAEFVALVSRAVAKAREKRYRRMADLLSDIDTLWSTLDETKSVIRPVAAVVESGPGGGHDDLTVFEEQTHKLGEERERRRVLLLEAQVRESKQKAAREGQTVVEAPKRMEEVRTAAEQVGARGRFAEAFAAAEQKIEQGRRSEEGKEFAAATGWYEEAPHLTTLRPASPRYTPPPRPRPLAEPKPRRARILASLAVVSLIAAGLALYLQRPASEPPPKPTPAPALPTPAPTPSPVAPLPRSPVTPVTPTPELAPTDDIASLEAAAKRGEADAVVALVLRYWDRNQPGDAEKAVAILKRSDDPRALYLLGQCYANGRGIQRDVEQAFNLFDRAARLGDLDAKHDLAVMIMNPPSGVEANPRYAASLFKEGAQAGNVNCMNSYARCLWEGAGVHKDQDEALKWFRKAAAKGHQGAARWLEEHPSARDQD